METTPSTLEAFVTRFSDEVIPVDAFTPTGAIDAHLLMNSLGQVSNRLYRTTGIEDEGFFKIADYLQRVLSMDGETFISLERDTALLNSYALLQAGTRGYELQRSLALEQDPPAPLVPAYITPRLLKILTTGCHPMRGSSWQLRLSTVHSNDYFRIDLELTSLRRPVIISPAKAQVVVDEVARQIALTGRSFALDTTDSAGEGMIVHYIQYPESHHAG